jgi:hypothetical protein
VAQQVAESEGEEARSGLALCLWGANLEIWQAEMLHAVRVQPDGARLVNRVMMDKQAQPPVLMVIQDSRERAASHHLVCRRKYDSRSAEPVEQTDAVDGDLEPIRRMLVILAAKVKRILRESRRQPFVGCQWLVRIVEGSSELEEWPTSALDGEDRLLRRREGALRRHIVGKQG